MKHGTETWGPAGERLQDACKLLVSPSPENLNHCLALLEAAARDLRASKAPLRGGAARREARALRDLVQRAGGLLEGAAEFHRKWTELAGVITAGYAAGGRPGDYVQPGTFCLRG